MQNYSKQNVKDAKSGWNSPLNLFLSFILIVTLLFSIVNITGAWFTDGSADDGSKTINAIIKTGEVNLNVYQEDSTGTQTMLSKSLPTGYTQLEYIESTGTQYIDTGIYPSAALNTQLDFQFVSGTSDNGGGAVMGARPSNAQYYTFFVNYSTYSVAFNYGTYDSGYISGTKSNVKTTLYNDGGKFYQDGKLLKTATVTVQKSDCSIYLFGMNNNNRPELRGVDVKIYQCKMTENGVVTRNFIPAKNSSGTLGMYDLVEDKFYTNSGTGTFVAGSEVLAGSGVSLAYDSANKTNNKVNVAALPAGYTQLEYLQSSGTQYISTGVTPSADFGFEMDMQLLNTTADQKFMGSYSSGVFLGTLGGKWRFGNSVNINDVATTLNRTKVALKDGVWSFNGTSATTNESPKSNNWSISVFGVNYQGDEDYTLSSIKLFSLKFYKGGELIKNYIPAKNSSGVCGLYDLVEGKFYTNAGTGTFVAGAEINNAQNTLKLLLKNEDNGNLFGVRYKVEFYAATAAGKVKLSSNISGMTAPTSSTAGFVYNSADGYYYYQNSAGNNVIFEVKEAYLMTGFGINYDSAMSNLLGGNSIYMEITIESVTIT